MFAYSWVQDKNEDLTVIRIYGVNERDENVCLRINDFTPYAYIYLPEIKGVSWDEPQCDKLLSALRERLKPSKSNPKEFEPIFFTKQLKRRFFFVHKDPKTKQDLLFPYIRIAFRTKEEIRRLTNVLNYPLRVQGMGAIKLAVHETDATPLLQTTVNRKLATAGWLSYVGVPVRGDDKLTICDHEITCSWRSLNPIENNSLGNVLCLFFDIEAYSSVPSAMPSAKRETDKVFQISCVLWRKGQPVRKFLLSLFDPDDDRVNALKSDLQDEESKDADAKEEESKDVIPIETRRFKTENDLLAGMAAFFHEFKPNVMVGYNTFGFDWKYMIERANYRGYRKFFQQSFLKDTESKVKEIEWSSSACKNQVYTLLDTEGCLQIDLMPFIRREYPNFATYSLKAVSTKFIGATKDPLTPKGIFKCYDYGRDAYAEARKPSPDPNVVKLGRVAMGVVGKYCVQDAYLCTQLFTKLSIWAGLCCQARVCNVSIFAAFTQGQQLRVYSQVYWMTTHQNYVLQPMYQSKETDQYVGATVLDPVPGVYNDVVSFDFASLYPTTMIYKNICPSTLVHDTSRTEKDPTIPDSDCNVMDWEDHIGCEHDPKVIRIKALDQLIDAGMAELTKLREQRDKPANKLFRSEYTSQIEAGLERLKPLREERSDLKSGMTKFPLCEKRYFRWLKEPAGIFPSLCSNLLKARAETRAEIKRLSGVLKAGKKIVDGIDTDLTDAEREAIEAEIEVLDARQKAQKVSANSLYGSMGVKKGYIPFMPGAMSTTYAGRLAIEKASKAIREFGRRQDPDDEEDDDLEAETVYGDTDSNYVRFPGCKTKARLWIKAIKISRKVSDLFPKPMNLVFEDTIYHRFIIFSKKRYMYLACGSEGMEKPCSALTGPDGGKCGSKAFSFSGAFKTCKICGAVINIVKPEVGKKGVLLARRDTCKFIRDLYVTVTKMIFDDQSLAEILDLLIVEMNRLCSYSIDKSNFVVTKSVGAYDGSLITTKVLKTVGATGMKEKLMLGDYTVRPIAPKNLAEMNEEEQKQHYLQCLPAQVQLAHRMYTKRGQFVAPGSRLEYVITTEGGHTAEQFVKIEDAGYQARHSTVIRIDHLYYLKQLINPMDQMLGLICRIKGFVKWQYKLRVLKSKVNQQIRERRKTIILDANGQPIAEPKNGRRKVQ